MCELLAHRHTPDIHTKWTRTSSVIYPPFADQTKTHTNETQHHNIVCLNITAWGSYPYASPERLGTTPFGKCQRWSTVGPLGAAMRLTTLRQSPNNMSRRENSGPPKVTPDPQNDSFPQPPVTANLSPETHKSAGAQDRPTLRTAAQHKRPVNLYYLDRIPGPHALHTWTCEHHQSPHITINKFSHQVSSHTDTHQTTRKCRLRRYGSGMRPRNGGGPDERPLPLGAPNISERSHPPLKLTVHCVETYIHLLPDSATYELPHTVSPLTDTSRPTGATHQRQLGSGMQLRSARGPGALLHLHVNRQ